MELFAIHCTTCKARLIVKDESVIGDILSCPKCHSMVQIVPPPGWSSPSTAAQPTTASKPISTKSAPATAASVAPATTHATPPPLAASAAPAASAIPTSVAAGAAVPPAIPPRVAAPAEATVVIPPAPSAEVAAATAHSEPVAEFVSADTGRDWTLIAAGVGGGVLLGAIAWFVIWLQSPGEVAVADKSTTAAAVAAPAAAPETSNAPNAESAPPIEAEPVPAAIPPLEEQPQSTDTSAAETAEAPVAAPVVAPAEAPAAAAPVEEPVPAALDEQPELKLDPVEPQTAAADGAVDSGDSLGEAAATEENAASVPADETLPALTESSAGEPAPLAVAEIQRRLGVTLTRVDFSAVPLGHLAGFLSDVSGARVVIDEPSLAKSGKSRKTPVTVRSSGTTALAILQAAAEQAGLDYSIEPGRITLSARGP